jgi:hypothetical protein
LPFVLKELNTNITPKKSFSEVIITTVMFFINK